MGEAEWRKAVEKVLKGAPFDSLMMTLADGSRLEPLLPSRREAVPLSQMPQPGGPTILSHVSLADDDANEKALHDLCNGANGLLIDCRAPAERLDRLLSGVELDLIAIRLLHAGADHLGALKRSAAKAGLDVDALAIADLSEDGPSRIVMVDADLLGSIARLRAMRAAFPAAQLHAHTSVEMLAGRAFGDQVILQTIAAAAAFLGGADTLCVQPGSEEQAARRIARNIPLMLRDESQLWRIADPLAGSGTIEALTDAVIPAGAKRRAGKPRGASTRPQRFPILSPIARE